MNVALSELPRFSSLPPDEDFHFKGAIELCPSLEYMQRAYREAKDTAGPQPDHLHADSQHPGRHAGPARRPRGEPVLPALPARTAGWQVLGRREGHRADAIIDAIDAHAPNFRSVVGRQIKSPLDIERDLNMVGGDIFHGALHLDQFLCHAPDSGPRGPPHADAGVYLCGSGAHPGGGVSGLPGHNAAQVILRDR
jgi:phytoene dehydrogenase-like protein